MPICEGLKQAGLIEQESKVVLEKPIGHDYDSAQRINATVKEYFTEKQIYRIDHYLGKETVQNLLVLRFANSIFEHQWNQKYIDHIQRSEEHTSELQSRPHLVCRLLLEKKNSTTSIDIMGLQAAYAHLHTDQERDYFMQRYHDVISSFGGKTSYDADNRPLLVMRSNLWASGYDVDGTDQTSLGQFSGFFF